MDCFDKFDPLNGDVPSYPFFELWQIAAQARIFLDGLSVNDVRSIEQELDVTIFDTKEGLAQHCLDDYVAQVIKDGSWELDYLPAETAPTPQSVKRLLENWPVSADEIDYLKEDDFSDVEALRTVFSWGGLATADSSYTHIVQCAAVLALMKVAECLDTLKCPEEDLGTSEDGPVAARLINAANYAIEAAQAIGYASEIAAVIESEVDTAENLEETNEEKQRQFSVERAKKAATARHEHLKPAVEFVRAEWQKHCEAYKFNKTDFARTYVELVRNRHRDRRGDPLKVTIKTITDVWLAPPASKPTAVPARG